MASNTVCLLILTSVCLSNFCVGDYAVPEIKFEAFEPKGLRISIPAEKGVEFFAFHGNVNKDIQQIEPGAIVVDVTTPKNGRFSYTDRNVTLKKGDVIHYWAFVQHDSLGYRKDDQTWTVGELQPEQPEVIKTCKETISKVKGKEDLCSGDDIIDYEFTQASIDPNVWITEQYIPNEPDTEYVVYTNKTDVISVNDNVLRIWPKVVPEMFNSRIFIEGCTHPDKKEECERDPGYIKNPPILSGKIISKDAFCFGEISFKAKLPQGDWIYPQIYLEDINDPNRRILLAYARGNRELKDSSDTEIGGKLLYGGPYTSPKISVRDKYLAKKQFDAHIGENWHVFTVRWAKDQMDLKIDNEEYGSIGADALRQTGFDRETMVRLILGLGVGGKNDFPEGSISGAYRKPWKSLKRTAIKDFFDSRDKWEKTWRSEQKLLVEYVTVKAL